MEEMIRVSILCVAACLLANVVQQSSRVMGLVILLAAGSVVCGHAIEKAGGILRQLHTLTEASGIEGALFAPVVRVLGIALCGRITGELCRDMGSRWAAAGIELFAVITSLVCMLPLVEEVLRLVGSI